jgi:hypothetical protein
MKTILIFRGTRDGFMRYNFNEECLNKGSTVTLIKSEHNKIFGGFTSLSWRYHDDKPDPKAFIFSLSNKNKHLQSG